VRIRTAIFVVYVVASAAGFAVLMRFMLAEVRPRYVESLRTSLNDAARLLAASLDGRELPRSLEAVQTGVRMRVLAEDGRLLLDSAAVEEAEPARSYEESGERGGLAKRMGERLLDAEQPLTDDEVRVRAPVVLAAGEKATIELARPIRTVNALIWLERKKLAGMSLVIAGVMVVAGWFIATRLTRSLERLTEYAQRVRDGKKAIVPLSRAKEIAAMGRAFEEMRESLEGRQHVERYTQTLAHEVKAPLAAIRGAAELMDEDMPVETRRKFLGNIRSEAARIQAIIERLLELSSLEARKALRTTEEIAAADLIAEAVAVVRPSAEARGVKLVTERRDGARMRGERVLLREALVNLLQNAVEFSSAGGAVTVREERDGKRVCLVVEDEGPGVPEYALGQVFERFYSLPRPGTAVKSTGLGLTLVREIAHLHGGEAKLENRVGGGARAVMSVPAAAAAGA